MSNDQSPDELDQDNPLHQILIKVYFSDYRQGKEATILGAEQAILRLKATWERQAREAQKKETAEFLYKEVHITPYEGAYMLADCDMDGFRKLADAELDQPNPSNRKAES